MARREGGGLADAAADLRPRLEHQHLVRRQPVPRLQGPGALQPRRTAAHHHRAVHARDFRRGLPLHVSARCVRASSVPGRP